MPSCVMQLFLHSVCGKDDRTFFFREKHKIK